MKEQFIPYNLALDLKELGFNIQFSMFGNNYYYDGNKGMISANEGYLKMFPDKEYLSLILWQQAFDWFRSKGLDSFLRQTSSKGDSYWKINKLETSNKIKGYSGFTKFYEEAKEVCLTKLIDICKNPV